ncbi:SpoIID/LytB domain-containing protein [Synechococcus sp. CBW1004]|uniref:SpoIID/LytB domain-containing protein n=1 Tax=Synechococcus sp. CBW1004 TaxID=1353136 RepID=UPI001E2AF4D9|nr:SpoIID/LytB domain-containing protein [Synechococcus sp. CBW1004]
MAGAGRRRLIRALRLHPVLVTAPLAALAVGAGFGAQALLRPETHDRDLLEALIARPEVVATTAPGQVRGAAPADANGLPASLQAQRAAAASGGGGALAEPQAGPEVPLEIRVALLKLSGQPSLSASGPWRLSDRTGRLLRSGAGGEAVPYQALLGELSELWLETSAGGRLKADGRSYEGRMRLLRGDGGVRVVNHLPLETYVSSVVGGEMPSSWNPEALRAQAVAARSYAMAHMARPAGEHWHLGDTTRWQNYEGLGSVSAATRSATASTAGIILSYQGGIVESLYAATQQIVDEAHAHLGASMSQTGAQQLAAQGLRYNEILGRYYRGASLARLQAGAR